ncbi:MAG: OmpA family protein [Flavobacteriales bacterium]
MKYFFLLLCCFSSVYAQENCNLSVDVLAKKHFKKAKRQVDNFKVNESIKSLEKAISIQENYADAYFLLGQLYELKKIYQKAIHNFEKTTVYCPMYSSSVYWSLAELYFEEKEYEKAKIQYQTFLKFIATNEDQKALARSKMKLADFYIDIYSNPVPYNPQFVKGISTSNDEYLSALSPDNDFAFFTRRITRQDVGMLRPETVEEFTISTKLNGEFNEGQKMSYPFNMRKNEGGPSLSLNNRELYFTVCEKEKSYNNCDIFYSYKKYENWSELERLPYPINKSNSWESQPSISSDGNTLIFSSIRQNGVGEADIYSITKDENGKWGELVSLSINTKGNEKSPFLHPDGKTLYFSSDTHLGLGGFDIFYCKKDTNGNWSEPVNIGYPINSEKDDLAFFVSIDGKTAYFSSNQLSGAGGWDLYAFSLYKDARPEKIMFIKGEVKGEYGEMLFDAVIEVKSIKTKAVSRIEVNQETGAYVGVVTVDEEEDLMITVKSKDYAFNSQYLKSSAISSIPQQFDFSMQAIEEDKSFRINNIYFESDKFELNDQAKIVLSSFVEFMTLNPNIEVEIQGHTDNVGDKLSNKVLSENRAKKVHDYLVSNGVKKDRMSYKGFGESKPLVSNDSDDNRKVNRRTEFFIVKK